MARRARSAAPEPPKTVYKNAPITLPGAVYAYYTRCGKVTCGCNTGSLHGPYHYRKWRAGGRQYLVYVRPGDVDAVRAACERGRAEQVYQKDQIRAGRLSVRQLIAELRRYGW